MFGVTESTVKRWSNSGKLHCFRTLGGHRRFTAEAILAFIERFNYTPATALPELPLQKEETEAQLVDFLLLQKDYRFLREVYFSDALKGNTESLAKLLVNCSFRANIPLTVIYEEIVSKVISKINNLRRQRKIDVDQQKWAISAILESFVQLNGLPRQG